ncbi:hypothetical protein COO60DRAFT_1643123 [Scenedesmus sp. NREL 46B-D3]|nr:hypothetical protein COO60DRAFT_1643123 [Scenedesmus sp. NREL 46B-D3]
MYICDFLQAMQVLWTAALCGAPSQVGRLAAAQAHPYLVVSRPEGLMTGTARQPSHMSWATSPRNGPQRAAAQALASPAARQSGNKGKGGSAAGSAGALLRDVPALGGRQAPLLPPGALALVKEEPGALAPIKEEPGRAGSRGGAAPLLAPVSGVATGDRLTPHPIKEEPGRAGSRGGAGLHLSRWSRAAAAGCQELHVGRKQRGGTIELAGSLDILGQLLQPPRSCLAMVQAKAAALPSIADFCHDEAVKAAIKAAKPSANLKARNLRALQGNDVKAAAAADALGQPPAAAATPDSSAAADVAGAAAADG